MVDLISWSVNAVASSGAASKAAGVTTVDGIFSAKVAIPKPTGAPADVPHELQLETATRFRFLAITCPDTTGKIEVTGTGSSPQTVALHGPLILHGDAIKLFTGNLSTLKVKNTSGAATELSIVIGYMFA